jgi:hypothetical protein
MITDTTLHAAIIKLVIAYTLLGAFIFTVIITCLSLIGIVKFANPGQQRKLFAVLIVELVVICVGVFADFLQFSPKEVRSETNEIVAQALEVSETSAEINKSRSADVPPPAAEVQAAQVPATTPEQTLIDDLVAKLFSPSGRERTVAYEKLTNALRTKDYAVSAILQRGNTELDKPVDQQDFIGVYHTIVTLTDMSRAVTQKPEFKDRIVDYANRATKAFPRLETRAKTLKAWTQSARK